jgi:hypothetical protein
MTLTIETNKRSFINAIVALCKSVGISSYKVENTAQTPKAAVAEILAARAQYDSGDSTDITVFETASEMRQSYGL